MAAPISFKRRLERKLPRVAKSARQWTQAIATGGRPETRLVFVVGAQRSGTRLPLQVLDHASDISTFSEGTDPFFDGVLLRPLDQIEALVRRSASPIVALKPICETHRVNELLDRFAGSKAIWIFRNYQDTVSSASIKWTSGKESLRRIAHREFGPGEWRVGGLTEEKFQLVSRLYHEDMSLHEANAVLWYLRNALFFDLKADERSDVLLVRYEDLVARPREQFARIFAFIGTSVPTDAVDAIKGSERAKRFVPGISHSVAALCEDVQQRLIHHYSAQNQESRATSEIGR
ncbi:MAG TPA: sulfotransferase domain-containing protein [Vicinamibacterales bacterium]|nr:sulfotransferase domain-containing protein [Vicinamibacterales bacterium]